MLVAKSLRTSIFDRPEAGRARKGRGEADAEHVAANEALQYMQSLGAGHLPVPKDGPLERHDHLDDFELKDLRIPRAEEDVQWRAAGLHLQGQGAGAGAEWRTESPSDVKHIPTPPVYWPVLKACQKAHGDLKHKQMAQNRTTCQQRRVLGAGSRV